MKHLIMCLLLGSASSVVFASEQIQIPVQQPMIPPLTTSMVWLEPLMPNVMYKVTCIVENNYDVINVAMAASGFDYEPSLAVNGNAFSLQSPLGHGDNTLQLLNFIVNSMDIIPALMISNIDDHGTLMIKQCYADPYVITGLTGESGVSELPGQGQQ